MADPGITPDSQFCMNDANIALITSDSWAFCVHKSVLGRLSVVFRNMFEVCSPPTLSSSGTGKFYGLDVIEISESHDIVRSFFTIVYDQKPVTSIESYAALGGLITFCNKYLIHSIMKRIVTFLRPKFPNTLDGYAERVRRSSLQVADIVHITKAALEANLKTFLVVGLYFLAVNRDTTTEYLAQFPHELLMHYGHGLSKLSGTDFRSKFNAKFNAMSFKSSERCSHSFTCRDSWRSFKDTRLAENSIGFLVILLQCSDDISPMGVCKYCATNFKSSLRSFAEYLWTLLPEAFGIGENWEILEEEEEEKLDIIEG